MSGAVLLAALSSSWGCASPETMSSVGTRIFGAIPGLSYVNGDVEEGTTTLASLSLLTYRTTEEHPGYSSSEAWVLPLLGRFAQTDRYVLATWAGKEAQGPPPDWWDRDRKRDGKPKRKRRRRTRPAPDPDDDASASEEAEPSRKGRKRRKGKGKNTRGPAPVGTVIAEGKEHLLLHLKRPGRIVRQLPQQKTEWDILLGLIGHHAERPARVIVRPLRKGKGKGKRRKRKGKKLRKGDVLYEIGETRDSFRLLPLFSYRRGPEGKQFMFWPLLVGWEREGRERYMRLFYFIKVPLK